MVTARKSSSTSLRVEWSHLQEKHFNGHPAGYNITYYPLIFKSTINFLTVNYATNTTTLTNLTVYTMYVINVSAVSHGGIGPAITTKAQTDAAGMRQFFLY